MSEITVVNKKHGRCPGVYIGRPSVFGNPFRLGRDGNRERILEKYDTWLRNQLREPRAVRLRKSIDRLVEFVEQGNDLTLICWCKPLACHGDIIKTVIEERLRCANNSS